MGSSINIFRESDVRRKEKEVISKTETEDKTYFQRFIDFFDLTLLSDPIFVNMLVGMSLASCVETNFSLLFPIILKDMLQFETYEIAKIMAVIGFSDTLFRLLSPFIGEWCNKPPRVMYLVSLLVIIFTRTSKSYFYFIYVIEDYRNNLYGSVSIIMSSNFVKQCRPVT